jgi:hypothetical protein
LLAPLLGPAPVPQARLAPFPRPPRSGEAA